MTCTPGSFRNPRSKKSYPSISGICTSSSTSRHCPLASNYFSNHRFLHHFGAEMVLLFPRRHSTNENHQVERTLLFEGVLGKNNPRWIVTTVAYNPPLRIPGERASEVALEQGIRGDGLDRGIDVTESDDRQQKADHGITIPSQPVQIALGTCLAHEEHDGRAAVERGNRE